MVFVFTVQSKYIFHETGMTLIIRINDLSYLGYLCPIKTKMYFCTNTNTMKLRSDHTFHIPVMGLGFTIDTPVKVAHFGISSVLSIVEDHLIEQMREVICRNEKIDYVPIVAESEDSRAKRITAYLNLVEKIVNRNMENLIQSPFEEGSELTKYFELLPEDSATKSLYHKMLSLKNSERIDAEIELRKQIIPGTIDVNIMTKVDKTNYGKDGEPLAQEYSDALSALRGFANSNLSSSVVFSAGLNPRLYSYCEKFEDFYPDINGKLKKKIILKVSDYRSAYVQGKFLAKKGLWISEFRIESGLNCGGHAFATDGLLLGPILEEFKLNRGKLFGELYETCCTALVTKGKTFRDLPILKISAQGGIGTASENKFLLEYYNLDATGWGSPFLLVPEATSVDNETVQKLATARQSDYFLSHSSPLGIPFNNFRHSSSEAQRQMRIAKSRPGSPCYKKFLSTNTEFTERPICTASREYQNLKIKQAQEQIKNEEELDAAILKITEKDCLCEGLGAAALIVNETKLSHGLKAVAICPGPNLAYFSGVYTLREMVDHIYGRSNILNSLKRPHVFVNELKIYIDYFRKEVENSMKTTTEKQVTYFNNFKKNILCGIDYYTSLVPYLKLVDEIAHEMKTQLMDCKTRLELVPIIQNI